MTDDPIAAETEVEVVAALPGLEKLIRAEIDSTLAPLLRKARVMQWPPQYLAAVLIMLAGEAEALATGKREITP